MTTAAETQGVVPIEHEGDIITVRRSVRETATRLGFGITDVTRIVTAASELARNIVLYAGSGVLEWRALRKNNRVGLELAFIDHGPGIPDTTLAFQEGYSTSGGLGMGLPGSRRLMDELELKTGAGQGTTVIIRKWMR